MDKIMVWLGQNWKEILLWIGFLGGCLNALIAFLKVMGYPQAAAWFGKLEDALAAAYLAFINSKKPPTPPAAVAVILFCLLAGSAFADPVVITDSLKNIPAMKQGVAYSIADSKLNYLTTFDVASYKDGTLELGYAGQAPNTGDKFVAVVSYDIANMKKLGVKLPVLDLIDLRLGLYAGVGSINIGTVGQMKGNNEFDYGVSATAIAVKF